MADLIPEDKINEIRERANIVEVISDFVSLKKSGKNYLGLCPFHSERTPSFTVNEEKGIFHCFGCGAGGNIFSFLMRASQLSFPEAVKELAKRYGIKLPERELSEEEKRQRSLKARLFEVNELAAEYFHEVLQSHPDGEEGRRYLAGRGLSKEIILEHRLGFALPAWDSLVLFLQKKGVPLNLAETLGLILPRKEGQFSKNQTRFFDRFRRRVMFPIFNEAGRVIGFGGRILEEGSAGNDPPSPKYMNSPESPIYSKGHSLYGLPAAKGPIREEGFALLVEGYMDLLSLYQEGIHHVVASLGTALTPFQLNLLGRYAREAVLVFDADESGIKATQRSLELFLQEGVKARVVSLPLGFDPDRFIRQEKKAGFERLLADALPLPEYWLQQALRRHPAETVEGKVRVVRELVPVLNRLRDSLERDLYIEKMALRLGLKESQIRGHLRGREREDLEPGMISPREAPGPLHERLLLQLMLMNSSLIPRVTEGMGPEGFSESRHQKLACELQSQWKGGRAMDVQQFINGLSDEDLKDLVSELLLEEERIVDAERILRDCLRTIQLSRVRQEIQKVDEEIRQRSQKGKQTSQETQGLKELLQRKQRLIIEQKKWFDGFANEPQPLARQ